MSDFGWIELPSRKKGMKTQYDRLSFEDKAAIGDRMIKPIMEIYAKMSVNVYFGELSRLPKNSL